MESSQMSEAELHLYFSYADAPWLMKTVFKESPTADPIVGLQGIHLPGTIPIRWSVGTKALSLFFLRAKLACDVPGEALLAGQKGSPAASLDYLLWSPSVSWIQDIFGVKRNGASIARRIIHAMNSRQKMKGPVLLYLNTAVLEQTRIHIYLDGREVLEREEFWKIFMSVEDSWKPYKSTKSASSVEHSEPLRQVKKVATG